MSLLLLISLIVVSVCSLELDCYACMTCAKYEWTHSGCRRVKNLCEDECPGENILTRDGVSIEEIEIFWAKSFSNLMSRMTSFDLQMTACEMILEKLEGKKKKWKIWR